MDDTPENKAEELFLDGYACSQAVLLAFCEKYGLEPKTAGLLSSNFGGGMGRLRKTCGALTGAFMVLGLEYGNDDPKDMDTKLASYRRVREFAKKFTEKFGSTECGDIIKKHAKNSEIVERKHHKKICNVIVREVHSMLADELPS